MKTLRDLILTFVAVAMLPLLVFAQEKEVICRDEACVMEFIKKLDSTNDSVALNAQKTLESLADKVRYTGDSDMKNALLGALIMNIHENPKGKNVDFLMSLFPKFCGESDIRVVLKLKDQEALADKAIRTIGDIAGSKTYIEKCIIKGENDLNYKAAWAYGVGKQIVTRAEDVLISWLKDADVDTSIEIYKALVVIRSNEKTSKIIIKGAKKLYKSKNVEHQIVGMQLYTAVKGDKALPMLYKSLKSNGGKLRREALELMKPFADEKVCKTVLKKCKSGDALVDAINWLGEMKNNSQMEFLIKQLSSQNSKIVEATIRAIFKIDDADGINAVKPMFGGRYQSVIKESMITYEGDYKAVLNDVLKGDDSKKLAVLAIVESRPDVSMYKRVNEMTNAASQEVRDKAFAMLKLFAVPANADFLSGLLQNCNAKYVTDVQLAIKNSMAKASDEKKDEFASTLKHVKPNIMPRYYKVFAFFGTELCVNKLIDAYQNGEYNENAKEALLLVDNEAFKKKIQEILK